MYILILGGTGMLGHTAYRMLSKDFNVYRTIRCSSPVENFYTFEKTISTIKPDVVLNCIGITKEVKTVNDPIKTITINSLFPHRVAEICNMNNIRFIHISTDCVFSGSKGNYIENDIPDPMDLYGRSKLLGEVDYGNALTIRTSMIGRTLNTKYGLLEWFLNQNNKSVNGYTSSFFSGFTTTALCKILKDIITDHTNCRGIYHVSSEPINKFDLLTLIKNKMQLNIDIIPDDTIKCDRSLNSTKFRKETGYTPPTWDNMIKELSNE